LPSDYENAVTFTEIGEGRRKKREGRREKEEGRRKKGVKS